MASAIPPVMNPFDVPQELSATGSSRSIELHISLRLSDFLEAILYEQLICFLCIWDQGQLYHLSRWILFHFDSSKGLNRLHPLVLSELYLSCVLIERSLDVVEEHHGEHEESGLLLIKFIGLDNEAVVLITVWILNQQWLLEESLPLLWDLPLNHMSQDEELFVSGALKVDEWHLFVSCKHFIVDPHDEWAPGLLLLLHELKILIIENLHILDNNLVLRLKQVDSLLVQISLSQIVGVVHNRKLVLSVLLGLQEEDENSVESNQHLRILVRSHGQHVLVNRIGCWGCLWLFRCTLGSGHANFAVVQSVRNLYFYSVLWVPVNILARLNVQLLHYLVKFGESRHIADIDDFIVNRLRQVKFILLIILIGHSCSPDIFKMLEAVITSKVIIFNLLLSYFRSAANDLIDTKTSSGLIVATFTAPRQLLLKWLLLDQMAMVDLVLFDAWKAMGAVPVSQVRYVLLSSRFHLQFR